MRALRASPATSRNRRARTALAGTAALAALALLLRLAYGPGDIGFDAAFALVWGEEFLRLNVPDYGAAVSPTPHPLANVLGGLASLAGDAGHDVLIAFSYVSFAALGLAAYVVGSRIFGAVAGVAFAAILLTRPLLVAETLQASIDVPFLSLVLGALALELGRERRGAPVLGALALAGLLRPEAWVLSLTYAAYLLAPAERRADRLRALGLVALALSAPLLWMLTDLVTTSDALYSLTGTQDLAERLQRERGLGTSLRYLPEHLRAILGAGVVGTGVVAGAMVLFAAESRGRLPLALLALGLANFVALGVADLPLLTRYVLVPAAAVALFCAGGLASFRWLRTPGRLRFAGVALSAVIAVTLLAGAPGTRGDLREIVDRSDQRRSIHDALVDLADTARARGLVEECGTLQAAVYRPVPVLAYRLGVEPSEIVVVRPFRARPGLVFAAHLETVVNDVGLYAGVVIPSDELEVPKSFTRVDTNRWWTLAARC